MGTITGGEARELYAANPVILLPMGSHEDQGPHAPMGDYLLAEKIAELAALARHRRRARARVVAPVLPFGGADFFGPMPGGIAMTRRRLTARHHRHGRAPASHRPDAADRHQRPWRQRRADRGGGA